MKITVIGSAMSLDFSQMSNKIWSAEPGSPHIEYPSPATRRDNAAQRKRAAKKQRNAKRRSKK